MLRFLKQLFKSNEGCGGIEYEPITPSREVRKDARVYEKARQKRHAELKALTGHPYPQTHAQANATHS